MLRVEAFLKGVFLIAAQRRLGELLAAGRASTDEAAACRRFIQHTRDLLLERLVDLAQRLQQRGSA